MRRPGANHIDRRRRLRPADYATDPHRFGTDPHLDFRVPAGGDDVSMKVARVQHQLVSAWRHQPGTPSGAALARGFGCSKQTFSRTVLGHRWAGETLLAALLHALDPATPPRPATS
jgi:hypothetical protein